MSNKFKVGDWVRVTDHTHELRDRLGRVSAFRDLCGAWFYEVGVGGGTYDFLQHNLTLADPDVHTVLDQMDAQSGIVGINLPPLNVDQEIAAEYIAAREAHDGRVTAEDKLRLIADTVDAQVPAGSELAAFRRRLSAILSIGHDV